MFEEDRDALDWTAGDEKIKVIADHLKQNKAKRKEVEVKQEKPTEEEIAAANDTSKKPRRLFGMQKSTTYYGSLGSISRLRREEPGCNEGENHDYHRVAVG